MAHHFRIAENSATAGFFVFRDRQLSSVRLVTSYKELLIRRSGTGRMPSGQLSAKSRPGFEQYQTQRLRQAESAVDPDFSKHRATRSGREMLEAFCIRPEDGRERCA